MPEHFHVLVALGLRWAAYKALQVMGRSYKYLA